ncbi:hypothetical protein, partial [Streptococcus pneumoniae]|uniref:hypothetical protein n=1 Tax=Streptococcus pneumoniae TaxID=1313 RepID=UPI001E2FBB87
AFLVGLMFALCPFANCSGVYADPLANSYQVHPVSGLHFIDDPCIVPRHCLPAFRQSPVVKHQWSIL